MATIKQTKLNSLMKAWLPGTVAVQAWLATQGISPHLSAWYLKAGWLDSMGRGAYKRPGDRVNWQGGLYAIQQHLKLNIHLAAKSALEVMGHMHYLRLGQNGNFYFFGEQKTRIPMWFKKCSHWDISVKYFTASLFSDYRVGLIEKSIDNIPLIISEPERAIMETLYLIPDNQGLDEAYLLMQGLRTLRPKEIQKLLEACRSIKVKRLFMHLAELHNLPFLQHIDVSNIDFGKGKRRIAKGGVYHAKYQLSLPKIREEQ